MGASLTTVVVRDKQLLFAVAKQLLYDGTMNPLQQAVEKLGSQAALASEIGVKQQHVWNWLNRRGGVPPEHCAAIEKATNKAVRRWDLRPDDWHHIWPELVGEDGAPEAPAKAEA